MARSLPTGSPCRARRTGTPLRSLASALLAALPFAAQALPEDALLAAISGDFRQPQLRCEWIAGRFETIPEQLSLYREELAAFVVTVDGVAIGDSTTGAVLSVEFESRRSGPGSATLALDRLRAPALVSLAPGRRIEIQFADRNRQLHPLFCGQLALIRADPASTRVDVVALMPRTGAESRVSEHYQDMSCADVLKQLATAAGLAIELQDRRPRIRFPSIARNAEATWPFMRTLGRLCRYDLALQPDGSLRVTDSEFVPPPIPARKWIQLPLSDIAKQIAADAGRQVDARLTRVYPKLTLVQRQSDEDFLASLAAASQVSAWYAPGLLMLTEDGVWNPAPPAPNTTSPDALLWRMTATGSAAPARSFTRQHADPVKHADDPERLPLTQSTLSLGRAMAAAAPPRFALAQRATVEQWLEAALRRLAQSAEQTPERRFLQDYARAYRPTLLHLYRLRPDGLRELDAIGR